MSEEITIQLPRDDAQAILADIVKAKTAYAELMSNPERTAAQEHEMVEVIKALSRELDDSLTNGADVCETCGNKVMGMLKTPAYTNNGIDVPAVFEIGCVHCPPLLVERENGKALVFDEGVKLVKRRSYSARGTSAEEARKRWNEKQWVEDFYFDRIPGFTPVYAEETTA